MYISHFWLDSFLDYKVWFFLAIKACFGYQEKFFAFNFHTKYYQISTISHFKSNDIHYLLRSTLLALDFDTNLPNKRRGINFTTTNSSLISAQPPEVYGILIIFSFMNDFFRVSDFTSFTFHIISVHSLFSSSGKVFNFNLSILLSIKRRVLKS